MKSTQSLALFGVLLFLGLALFGAPALSAIQPEASWVAVNLFLGVVLFVSYIVIASFSDPKNTVRRSYTKIFA